MNKEKEHRLKMYNFLCEYEDFTEMVADLPLEITPTEEGIIRLFEIYKNLPCKR